MQRDTKVELAIWSIWVGMFALLGMLQFSGCVSRRPRPIVAYSVDTMPHPVMVRTNRAALVVQPPTTFTLLWDYEPSATELPLAQVGFTVIHKTNLQSGWTVLTNVLGTNRVTLPKGTQDFFNISRVYELANTNNYLKLDTLK